MKQSEVVYRLEAVRDYMNNGDYMLSHMDKQALTNAIKAVELLPELIRWLNMAQNLALIGKQPSFADIYREAIDKAKEVIGDE